MDMKMIEDMIEAEGDGMATSEIDKEMKDRLRPYLPTLAGLLGTEKGKRALICAILASASSTIGENIADYMTLLDSPVLYKTLAAAFLLGAASQLEETDGS